MERERQQNDSLVNGEWGLELVAVAVLLALGRLAHRVRLGGHHQRPCTRRLARCRRLRDTTTHGSSVGERSMLGREVQCSERRSTRVELAAMQCDENSEVQWVGHLRYK